MSKKFKSQASSSRAAASALGGFGNAFGGASSTLSAFGSSAGAVSSLSYITEPPDLTTISEPDVVVAFKNLSKKDSTTKAKALEELQDFVVRKAEGNSTLEDGFLKAWFNVYPRLSIETTRRVRQVAHAVHGVVVSSAGKRVARLMPKIIGAWLAGLYDNDRPVMRAAQESLLQAFTTDAKRQGVWKAYQGPILDFVEDAILVQTPHTLSDDRSTKPDDMEMKHARVVATASYTCSNLLARLSPDELENNSEKLQTIIPNKKLWTFAHHDDAFVRRATYALLQAILPMADSFIDWKIISSSVLSKALAKSQTGSSLEFVNLLVALTEKQPSIWTSDYTGKKSASSRLSHYLKNGSESAPAAYWEAITKLLHIIPSNVFGSSDGYTLDDATSIMDALHEAFLSRDEYRPNLSAAWTCYISTASRFARQLTNDNDKRTF
ncbi:TATA-binding protein-associated factor mot1, partial [Ascosphaera pollenicola]